eukprot:COSAG01_NODE_418_length_17279_cov_69.506228_15_plen_41_part_00
MGPLLPARLCYAAVLLLFCLLARSCCLLLPHGLPHWLATL